MSTAKQKMIEGAVQLLATKGLQATSFSEVLELTGAPRGSIYYHFPNGKDQLVAAAIELAGKRTLDLLETKRDASTVEITEFFLDAWRKLLNYSHFRAGCSVLAVTVAADSPELLEKAAEIFDAWQNKLTELYVDAGIPHDIAYDFSLELISASEGAVVLSRAKQSIVPFESVAARLLAESADLR
jgi:AcrR family transcriptional regulator